MKYILEEYTRNNYNAGSKAREDASRIVLDNGYVSIGINNRTSSVLGDRVGKLFQFVKVFILLTLKLRRGDTVFFQQSFKLLRTFVALKKIIGFKIIYLIHDVYSIKYDDVDEHKGEIESEMSLLSNCDYVIAHNSTMINRLKEYGCTTTLLNLEIFDYLTETAFKERKFQEKPCVVFAGAIDKSPFLAGVDNNFTIENLDFYLYGKPAKSWNHIIYKGCVDAAILPDVIEGNYGLIWEGDYKLTEKDNYTRFNNPHKASLYINSGLPLIVWDKSAIAKFVESEGIGICINSLDDLCKRIKQIDSTKYQSMCNNCKVISERLKKGYYLSNALSKVL